MTREELIALAQEAGFWREHINVWMCNSEDIEDFAALVAAAERERCAHVVDDFGDEWMCDSHMLSRIIRELK